MGTFGKVEIKIPRARLRPPEAAEGSTSEWKTDVLPAYQCHARARRGEIPGGLLG
jgi:hypothetical protein